MSQEEVLSGLAVIVNEVAGVPVEQITMEKSFVNDLDVDSLSMVEVVMAAEDCKRSCYRRRRSYLHRSQLLKPALRSQ
jgi:hypothetical protein